MLINNVDIYIKYTNLPHLHVHRGIAEYVETLNQIQRGPKVTSLVASSSRGRCAQPDVCVGSGVTLAHAHVTQMLRAKERHANVAE
jgi:hypothetical protein